MLWLRHTLMTFLCVVGFLPAGIAEAAEDTSSITAEGCTAAVEAAETKCTSESSKNDLDFAFRTVMAPPSDKRDKNGLDANPENLSRMMSPTEKCRSAVVSCYKNCGDNETLATNNPNRFDELITRLIALDGNFTAAGDGPATAEYSAQLQRCFETAEEHRKHFDQMCKQYKVGESLKTDSANEFPAAKALAGVSIPWIKNHCDLPELTLEMAPHSQPQAAASSFAQPDSEGKVVNSPKAGNQQPADLLSSAREKGFLGNNGAAPPAAPPAGSPPPAVPSPASDSPASTTEPKSEPQVPGDPAGNEPDPIGGDGSPSDPTAGSDPASANSNDNSNSNSDQNLGKEDIQNLSQLANTLAGGGGGGGGSGGSLPTIQAANAGPGVDVPGQEYQRSNVEGTIGQVNTGGTRPTLGFFRGRKFGPAPNEKKGGAGGAGPAAGGAPVGGGGVPFGGGGGVTGGNAPGPRAPEANPGRPEYFKDIRDNLGGNSYFGGGGAPTGGGPTASDNERQPLKINTPKLVAKNFDEAGAMKKLNSSFKTGMSSYTGKNSPPAESTEALPVFMDASAQFRKIIERGGYLNEQGQEP